MLRAEEASTIPVSEVGNRSVAIHQKDIRRDVDIATGTTEGVGQDLAIIQDDEIGIDSNVPTASYPALNTRRDLTVSQMN